MGAQENIKVVQELMQAFRNRDEKRYSELLAEDAVIRVAGVPRALGGVTQGREQILANFRQQAPAGGEVELRSIFADENHVCAVQKFSTYGAVIYELAGGRIREQTVYMNFLDVYVQAGLVPLSSLTAQG